MARESMLARSKQPVPLSVATASVFALVIFAITVMAPEIRAEGVGPCKREAKQEYRECTGDCKEDYQLAKDNCFARDHECVEICRDERQDCREPHVTARNAAIDECNATLADAKIQCRAQYADGTVERDQCIDQAQVVAFKCRDQARETVRFHLKDCRRAFRNCVRTECPPDVPVDPATARACKDDAKHIYKACKQDCREEYQLAKDTCLNRDHECVEACRVIRTDCRQPILDIRDAAVELCNTDRAAAIANCKDLYEPQTPDRDVCIDQAQVEAFQCRDEARELARPDLNICRDAFRTCAQACPPAAE